jgi:HK97 family phage prohead protease
MSDRKEFRFTPELRASGTTSKPMLSGYAAVFNQRANIGDRFMEVIMPGAFKRCLQGTPDVRALVDHEPAKILGRTVAGTLRLSEDSKGLRCEIDLPDTQLGRDVYTSVQRGDLSQMSFGFNPVDENVVPIAGAPGILRELCDVDVFDVSVVTFPAYEGTSITARSLRSLFPQGMPEHLEKRNLQRTLRNHNRPEEEEAFRAENRRKLNLLTDDDKRAQETIEAERRRIAAF